MSFTLSVTVKAVIPPVPTPTPTPTAKTYGKNQTWRVPGQWEFTVNRVYEISERNPYSSIIPAQVMMIEYTYKNLGYQNKWGDGLYLTPAVHGKFFDSKGFSGSTYPGSITYYPEELPIGMSCNAQECVYLRNKSNYLTMTMDVFGSNSRDERATFVIPIE